MNLWRPGERSDFAKQLYAQAASKQRATEFTGEVARELACAKTGLEDFGDGDIDEGLAVLVDSIVHEARLNPLGMTSNGVGMPVDMLRARLELVAARKEHPQVFERPIERPIVIVGGSRTGTTLLQRMLGSDPRLRTPRLWEMTSTRGFAFGGDEARSRQRNRADLGQKMLQALNPAMKAVHYSEADGPEECVMMMGTDLRNHALLSCMNVPGYQAWLERQDMRESYRRHRAQAQLLDHGAGRDGPPPRWLFKAPYHLPALEALAEAYPDACVVHTHRDVVQTVTSTCSLYATFRSTFSDSVDPVEIGRQQQAILPRWFESAVRARRNLAESGVRFFDVAYDELVADPLAMAARILTFAGLEPTDDSRASMSLWLDANRYGGHGGHSYAPHEFAIDADALRDAMTSYRREFDVT